MNYLDYYELAQEPFSNAPVSRFYFNSPQHSQALVRLTHLCSQMKGLGILVGDIGAGKTTLARRLLDSLPEGEQLYPDDYLTDQPERTLVAEMVREQVLRLTHAEIPFSTAVIVDQFEEVKDGRLLRIYCTIFVERDSQKPIVIGRGGDMIKQIGTAARQEIETFFQTKVFLDLRVAVKEQWRDDERILDSLGVRPPGK